MLNAYAKIRDRASATLSAAALVLTIGALAADGQEFSAPQRGPLARLVKTPDEEAGVPPYALADQTGAIQRYVEPVPGIELESHIGQIVSVRHDTGETLLASQLELPQQSLYPLVGEDHSRSLANSRFGHLINGKAKNDRFVQQADFIDTDDSTVELIEDGQPTAENSLVVPGGAAPQGAIYPDGTPVYPGPAMSAMPMGGAQYYDPSLSAYPADYGMPPQHGMYPAAAPYDPNMGFVQPFGQPTPQVPRERPHLYGELEINFLRAHVAENTFGKLSEKYEFSPRFIIGFTDVGNLSGRVRYWIYGRGTNGLDDEDSVHIDFDVWDVEATHRFVGRKTEVELAAGARLATIEINDAEGDACGTDLLGITMAADGWTPLFSCSQGCFGWVYGGRLSVLAGDWGGDPDSDILTERVRDDNVVVHELYAGIGFTRCCRNIDLNARLSFEMQNWHSDVLSEAVDDGSIGFVGPGVEIGAQF